VSFGASEEEKEVSSEPKNWIKEKENQK